MTEPAHDAESAGSVLASLFRLPFAAAVNHLLNSASWARDRLRPHAGKTASFDLAPFFLALSIRDGGDVVDVPAAAPADVRFKLTPGIALRVLASDQNAWRDVRATGDTVLARDILYVAQNLRWDIEEDLSFIFGDIAAHRMVQAGSDFGRWQRDSAQHLARTAAAYWTEERPLIATRADIERFLREVDILRDDVARAEKKVEKLLSGRIRPATNTQTSSKP